MVARTEEQRRRRADSERCRYTAKRGVAQGAAPRDAPDVLQRARPCALSACGKAESYAEPREKESPTSPEEEVNALVAGYAPCDRLLLLIPST